MSEVATTQPLLLDLPERPDLVELVRSRAPRGSYVARDAEVCDRIKDLMVLGRGLKVIERQTGISRHTLRRLREAWSASGELAPLKQRLSDRIGGIVEDGLDAYHQGILDGKVKPDQLPVGMGILIDKKAALDGEAGLVVEHRHTLDVDGFRRRLEEIRARMVAPAVSADGQAAQVVDVQEVRP